MRKTVLFFISICLTATIVAQQNITIKGHIDGLENEALVLRYRFDGTNSIDTIYAKNGDIDFVKEVNLTNPVYANLTYIGEKKNLISRNTSFFIDNGTNITLSGSLDEYYKIKAEGSPYFKDVVKLRDMNEALTVSVMKMQKILEDKEILGEDFIKTTTEKMYDVWNKVEENQEKFIKDNKNSIYSAFLKSQALLGEDLADLEAEYETYSENVKNSYFGKQIKTYIDDAKKVAPGAQAPNFTQKTKEGKTISLKQQKGKYVLLDFWGSWCGPCRRSHPHLVELYNTYKNEKFVLIGLASDRDKAKWDQAIIDDELTWPQINLFDKYKGEDVAKLYNVKAFPTKVLIDPNGKIIKTFIGSGEKESAELDALLKDIFGK